MRILLVDDDPLTLQYLAKTFREHGYAVDTAEDGEDGLFRAENCDYDAIVLDVVLPGLSGWEILTRLRATKKTPVLMLTSRKATSDQIRGLDTGADDYVVKPFDVAELQARLRALIRRTTQHARSSVTIGDVSVDLAARIVTRAGERIALSPREYSIVEHLILHRDKIVSRSELYEHVFDDKDDTLSNVIDVHVGKIRKKLGRDFIATHHGHGYSVAVPG